MNDSIRIVIYLNEAIIRIQVITLIMCHGFYSAFLFILFLILLRKEYSIWTFLMAALDGQQTFMPTKCWFFSLNLR